MPSAAHTLLLALHAAAFIALTSTSITSIHAVALPLPMPLPLLANDYSHNNLIATRAPPRRRKSTTKTMKNKHNETDIAHRPHAAVARVYPTTVDPMEPRQVDDRFASLNGYYTQADRHAKDLRGLAARSASIKDNDYDFQQDCASALTGFHTNLLGFQTVLAEFGADKGLANYDRTNDLETLLKNLVNLNKNALSAIDILVYNIPLLGPILGPIVYEIKCLLDEVLNIVENLTDAIINALEPLLQSLIGKAETSACRSGVELLGLCL